jgi:hypothetical protein
MNRETKRTVNWSSFINLKVPLYREITNLVNAALVYKFLILMAEVKLIHNPAIRSIHVFNHGCYHGLESIVVALMRSNKDIL